ncbi:MAG: hypothetical protein AAFU56_00420 [Pseudomonadota bacterium]
MRILVWLGLAFAVAFPLPALAGPEGSYTVSGTDPGSGGTYTGTVTVERTGETYAVLWEVNGTDYLGTGLGAANVKGTPTMGPASDQDTAIAISYVTDGSFGLTFYVEQENGQWKGIWTYGGSKNIGTEIWTPVE